MIYFMATSAKHKRAKPAQKAEAAFSRRTITLPRALEASVEKIAGKQQFSAFAARALEHEIQRERIAEWLEERLERLGPIPSEATAFAEAAWRKGAR